MLIEPDTIFIRKGSVLANRANTIFIRMRSTLANRAIYYIN